jgi:hypothetical protein
LPGDGADGRAAIPPPPGPMPPGRLGRWTPAGGRAAVAPPPGRWTAGVLGRAAGRWAGGRAAVAPPAGRWAAGLLGRWAADGRLWGTIPERAPPAGRAAGLAAGRALLMDGEGRAAGLCWAGRAP